MLSYRQWHVLSATAYSLAPTLSQFLVPCAAAVAYFAKRLMILVIDSMNRRDNENAFSAATNTACTDRSCRSSSNSLGLECFLEGCMFWSCMCGMDVSTFHM